MMIALINRSPNKPIQELIFSIVKSESPIWRISWRGEERNNSHFINRASSTLVHALYKMLEKRQNIRKEKKKERIYMYSPRPE